MNAFASALIAAIVFLLFALRPGVPLSLQVVAAVSLGVIFGPPAARDLRKFLLFLGDLADDLLGWGDSLPRRVSRKAIERKDREVAYYMRLGELRRLGINVQGATR